MTILVIVIHDQIYGFVWASFKAFATANTLCRINPDGGFIFEIIGSSPEYRINPDSAVTADCHTFHAAGAFILFYLVVLREFFAGIEHHSKKQYGKKGYFNYFNFHTLHF